MTHKESQLSFDFLTNSPEEKTKKTPLKGLNKPDKKKFTITYDRLNVMAILFIIILAMVFAAGVETGKGGKGYRGQAGDGSAPLLTPKEVIMPAKDQTVPGETTIDTTNIVTQLASREKEPPVKEVKKEEPKKEKVVVAVSKEIPAKASSGKSGNFTIQLVTHINENVAKKEMLALKNKGYKPFVIPSGKYIQVCVGNYPEKEDAIQSLKKFKNIYGDCFVRKSR